MAGNIAAKPYPINDAKKAVLEAVQHDNNSGRGLKNVNKSNDQAVGVICPSSCGTYADAVGGRL
ncbi:MAG: hypothetical protein ACJAYG_001832 [Oceanicoccus sp.]|jgi:hypothetical protein